MNSERMKIYSETYLFHHESADKLSHIRNDSNYNWTFQLLDDCDFFHLFWISWLQEKKHRKRASVFWRNYELFFVCCFCFSDEESVFDQLIDILSLSFFYYFSDTIFCFFRSSVFWLFRICFFYFLICSWLADICFSDFLSCWHINVSSVFEDSQNWCINSVCQKQ